MAALVTVLYEPAVPWPMRRPLKQPRRTSQGGGGLPHPAVPWPMRRPLKQAIRGLTLIPGRGPAVPWPMRRPLKPLESFTRSTESLPGSALADEEAIETHLKIFGVPDLMGPAVPWPMRRPLKPPSSYFLVKSVPGSALADEEAIETQAWLPWLPYCMNRQCLGR